MQAYIGGKWGVHLLGGLVRPKVQSPSSALHNYIGAQSAENAGFVVFGGIQDRNDGIIRVRELRVAGRTDGTLPFSNTSKAGMIRAINAEDMAREIRWSCQLLPERAPHRSARF